MTMRHGTTWWAMVAYVDALPGSLLWLRLLRRAKFLAALTLLWLGIAALQAVVDRLADLPHRQASAGHSADLS